MSLKQQTVLSYSQVNRKKYPILTGTRTLLLEGILLFLLDRKCRFCDFSHLLFSLDFTRENTEELCLDFTLHLSLFAYKTQLLHLSF